MNFKRNWLISVVIIFLISACTTTQAQVTTEIAPTNAPTLAPTNTFVPTNPPAPTATPFGGGNMIAYTSWRGSVKLTNSSGADLGSIGGGLAAFPQWSPDGKWMAYLVLDSLFGAMETEPKTIHTVQLWVAAADGNNALQIAEIIYPTLAKGNGFLPNHVPYNHFFWSPDSTSIAYLNYVNHDDSSSRKVDFDIYVASVINKTSVKVASLSLAWDDWTYRTQPLAWSPDGKQIAYTTFSNSNHGVYVVAVEGGDPIQLTDNRFANFPIWTFDGKSILFVDSPILSHTSMTGEPWLTLTPGKLSAVNIETMEVTQLSSAEVIDPVMSPNGEHIAYFVERTGVVSLNLSDLTELLVSPACVLFGNLPNIGWSPNGSFIAFESGTPYSNGCTFDDQYGWRVFNLEGAEIVRIPTQMGGYGFSPDSTALIATSGGSGELMMANLLDGSVKNLGIQQVFGPVWQPPGK